MNTKDIKIKIEELFELRDSFLNNWDDANIALLGYAVDTNEYKKPLIEVLETASFIREELLETNLFLNGLSKISNELDSSSTLNGIIKEFEKLIEDIKEVLKPLEFKELLIELNNELVSNGIEELYKSETDLTDSFLARIKEVFFLGKTVEDDLFFINKGDIKSLNLYYDKSLIVGASEDDFKDFFNSVSLDDTTEDLLYRFINPNTIEMLLLKRRDSMLKELADLSGDWHELNLNEEIDYPFDDDFMEIVYGLRFAPYKDVKKVYDEIIKSIEDSVGEK